MNRPIPGMVQVALRHIVSDQVSGGVVRPATRSISWRDSRFQVRRPQTGKQNVELTCPVCETALVAEVHAESRTRRAAAVYLVLAALSVIVLVAALAYAVHQGGKTLPEGQSYPALFPFSILAIFVTFVAAPLFYLRGRRHNGVSLLNAPMFRGKHALLPARS
ncbi:hypothetical protein [Streptomyces sp. NBC_01615]|uniref:hypothetical protein n=1 Tax=Streptomyces sp. NBC_01615 TaxID=2975898 RepID=UPI003866187A